MLCFRRFRRAAGTGLLAALLVTTAAAAVTPADLRFHRQASQRMVMDEAQRLPLAVLDPQTIVDLALMHPVRRSTGEAQPALAEGKLGISQPGASDTSLWFCGFNPFATYELALASLKRGSAGLEFRHEEGTVLRIMQQAAAEGGAVSWSLEKEGRKIAGESWPGATPAGGGGGGSDEPGALVVQMSGVGFNVFAKRQGTLQLLGRAELGAHLDLRKQEVFRRMSGWVRVAGESGVEVSILRASAALTPGTGQADLRAITNEEGTPLLENGRVWFTGTVRGGGLPHPAQGVFSLDPSVFDLRFEGMIVFDRGDGRWRNEVATHLYLDRPSGEWRGWTTAFSAYGDPAKREKKEILAVRSTRDPRRGFSVMKAAPAGLVGDYEDPHGVYDAASGKWQLLLCQNVSGYKAVVMESSRWDGGYQRIAGPVSVDSTGTTLQKFDGVTYALFGSADRRFHVCTFPALEPAGFLDLDLPPWPEDGNSRVWPNVVPLPEGYPAPYLLLTFDRANFPGMKGPNWTYGAMHLYHGYPVEGE